MNHKTKYYILMWLLLLCSNFTYAQFNTIGDVVSTTRMVKLRNSVSDTISIAQVEVDSIHHNVYTGIASPLNKIDITSRFGYRIHPITKKKGMHNGIDLRANHESVYSILPGQITASGYNKLSGKYVVIQTGGFQISYCHLSEIKVRVGECVKAGECVAISGNTGRSTGPHLHLTVRLKDVAIDPCQIIVLSK